MISRSSLAVATAIVALGLFATPAAAVNRCGSDPYAVAYEDANTNSGQDTLLLCQGESYTDLRTLTQPDVCNNGSGGSSSWNNCISLVRGFQWISNLHLCGFDSLNWGPVPILDLHGNSSLYGNSAWNDKISSIRWWTDTNPPSTCPGG